MGANFISGQFLCQSYLHDVVSHKDLDNKHPKSHTLFPILFDKFTLNMLVLSLKIYKVFTSWGKLYFIKTRNSR